MKQRSTESALDHPLMAEIYEKTAKILFVYIRSRLFSQEDAEDLLVEVFLVALETKGFPMFAPDKQFAWLRRVAQHKIVDRYRQVGHRPTFTLGYLDEMLNAANDETPERIVVRKEERGRLQATLQSLPPLQQQVIFLHFVDGLRCVEIARILGKRDGTIRVLLSRALNRLRTIYRE